MYVKFIHAREASQTDSSLHTKIVSQQNEKSGAIKVTSYYMDWEFAIKEEEEKNTVLLYQRCLSQEGSTQTLIFSLVRTRLPVRT